MGSEEAWRGLSVTEVVRQGFGRYLAAQQTVFRPERIADLSSLFAQSRAGEPVLVCGFGNSYGDAAFNSAGLLVTTERLNRILSLDPTSSLITVEAGVSVRDVMKVVTPRGLTLPATPGYSHISIGGCIAFDIHSKNHWRVGGFGDSVECLHLLLPDGSSRMCSRTEDSDLFLATIGGLGLTGVIVEATLRLAPLQGKLVSSESLPFSGVTDLLEKIESVKNEATHLVAWLDVLNRATPAGHLIVSRPYEQGDLNMGDMWKYDKNPPLELVSPFFNTLSNRAFNLAYGLKHRVRPHAVADLRSFLFPWDALPKWNRLYGKRGFVEYQCCIPAAKAGIAIELLLEKVLANRKRFPAYFAAVKRVRNAIGMLSFPLDGYSILLDFPVKDGLWDFLDSLDRVVADAGGRVYLAKDGRLSAQAFRAMYSRLDEWNVVRRRVDPQSRLTSDMAQRLQLTGV